MRARSLLIECRAGVYRGIGDAWLRDDEYVCIYGSLLWLTV